LICLLRHGVEIFFKSSSPPLSHLTFSFRGGIRVSAGGGGSGCSVLVKLPPQALGSR